MPVWRRYLMREMSGRLVELPRRAFDAAEDGTAPIPRLAGRCVDLVSAILVGDRAGQRVTEVAFTKLYFDARGFVDESKRDRMIRLMLESCADQPRPPGGTGIVVDARRAGAARLQLASEFGWQPKPAEVNEVLSRLEPPHTLPAGHTVH